MLTDCFTDKTDSLNRNFSDVEINWMQEENIKVPNTPVFGTFTLSRVPLCVLLLLRRGSTNTYSQYKNQSIRPHCNVITPLPFVVLQPVALPTLHFLSTN